MAHVSRGGIHQKWCLQALKSLGGVKVGRHAGIISLKLHKYLTLLTKGETQYMEKRLEPFCGEK